MLLETVALLSLLGPFVLLAAAWFRAGKSSALIGGSILSFISVFFAIARHCGMIERYDDLGSQASSFEFACNSPIGYYWYPVAYFAVMLLTAIFRYSRKQSSV